MVWWRRKQPDHEETTKEKGDRLEKRVEDLYRKMGKFNVTRNVVLKDGYGNISQIDVTYGIFFKKYIECKNYSGPVALENVAKFKEVLLLNGISPRRGIFITTSTYVPRALTVGIKTIDGDQLKELEKNALYYNIRSKVAAGGALLGVLGSLYYYRKDLHKLKEKKFWRKKWRRWKKWWKSWKMN